jgi:uncharacterized protein YecE (DUF72 family)
MASAFYQKTFRQTVLQLRCTIEWRRNRFHYRMPTATIEAWKNTTSDDFRFTIKASQQITHRERLKLPSDALAYFLGVVPGLDTRLGMVLYQLPPFFKCDKQRLELFVSQLPMGIRSAFEFRHESWFTTEIYKTLEEHGVALCVNDSDERTTPLELTAPFTYVRLRRTKYETSQLDDWRMRIRSWVAGGIDVFAYWVVAVLQYGRSVL